MTGEPPVVDDGPERYPRGLLGATAAVRLAYFERRCTIEHPHLQAACAAVVHSICSPSEEARLHRPGVTVLVIGPSRVGKTTLVQQLTRALRHRAQPRMRRDPEHIPVVRFTATGAASGRYDWVDYYKAVLRQLADPFVDRRAASLRTRDLREATEEALSHRHPSAVIIDEAQHLAKANTGRRLQDQLDHLKCLENRTGVSHVLVGTYEMRPFRTASAQLACRSLDVHFPRYDATAQPDRRAFRSVLWALQRQLPVAQEPCLTEEQWQFLYARSIGCIGLLKLHLNRALERALAEDADTVTEAHLRATALAEDRVRLALSAALAGEAELTESAAADQRLLALLGLEAAAVPGAAEALGRAHPGRPHPGERRPGRDAIGAAGRVAEEDRAGTDRAIG